MSSISVGGRRRYGPKVAPDLKLVGDSRPIALLAEPDRLRGALIVAGLEDLGVDVLWAGHGDTALESAEEKSFDVYVVDPSFRSTLGERVVELLATEHPRVPLVVTGSSAASVHLVSTRIPATEVVELVRAALGRCARPGQGGLHRHAQARANH
jgi:DNA-binding response OmpR family regulator